MFGWITSRKKNFIDGVALGLLLGSTTSFGISFAFDAVRFEISANISNLLAFVAALFAGLVALSGAYASIQHSLAAEERTRQRRLHAASATLPLVLSALYDICESRISEVVNGVRSSDGAKESLTENDKEVLRLCIENSDGSTSAALREIIAAYQVAQDNHLSLVEGIPLSLVVQHRRRNLYSVLAYWVSLRAFVSELFDFARTGTQLKERPNILGSCFLGLEVLERNGWRLIEDAHFAQFIESRKEKGSVGFSDANWLKRDT